MRNECNIIRDILPLYMEEMASADTAAFVEEHLAGCAACRAELENMRNSSGAEKVTPDAQDNDTAPLKAFRKAWNKRKRMTVMFTAIAVLLVLTATYFIGSGFSERTDVVLADYAVSEDGTEIILYTTIPTSMGYIRGFADNGGGVKPHYLTFYSTFGGLNSSFGARCEFVLTLSENDTEIYFNRADGGYALVLQKDPVTGEWVRPRIRIRPQIQD